MRLLIAGLCTSAVALFSSAPAMALIQRGHTFSSSFGAPGTGAGQLSNPAGVAVNESTGDVYVVDRANNRLEQFDAAGKFLSAWGWGVKDGNREYEICKKGEVCQPGVPGNGQGREGFHIGNGQLISPEAIAVDNSSSASSGDVYVVADVVSEHAYVFKFGPNGEFLRRLTSKAETEFNERVDGVAVDATGIVWVDWSGGEVTSFTGSEPNRHRTESEFEAETGAEPLRPGLAVDSKDNLYVNFEPSEKFVENEEGEEGKGEKGEEPCEGSTCFISKLTSVEVPNPEATGLNLEPGEALIRGLDGASSSARPLAVDLSSDDVYVERGSDVAAYTPEGTLIQRFGEGQLTRGSGIAVDSTTGAIYVADAGAGKVAVFVPESPTAPRVDEISSTAVTSEAGVLDAQVDPAGAESTVRFEYGTSACEGGGCTSVPYGKSISGFGDQAVSVPLAGLSPDTKYFYRVLAENVHGKVSSREGSFTTQPPVTTFKLADNRAWEMVSPSYKNGAGIESISFEGGLIEASESGNAITYIATGPSESEPEGNRSPAFTQNLATRSESGGPSWSSKEIAIPFGHPLGDYAGKLQEYLIFSPDLKSALVSPRGNSPESDPPLSPEAGEKTIYVRHNEGCSPPPSSCYVPVVTTADDTAEPPLGFGGRVGAPDTGIQFETGTPDLSHVVLSSEVPLTKEATAPSPSFNFYEWSAGKPADEQLQLINVLPGGTPAAGAEFGGGTHMVRNEISDDGNLIDWRAGEHLYVRNMLTRKTVQVDTPAAGVEAGANANPRFQTASSDGTRIFFTDEQRLTTDSTAAAGKDDLYEYDVTSGTLTDLSPGQAGEAAEVQYLVAGASEDGSTIYFVANGVLSSEANGEGEKATPGGCNPTLPVPGATCNLYVAHYNSTTETWGTPTFIAALSNEDKPDWGESKLAGEGLSVLTARVSPNGEYLAFMSDRSLTGYDNRDANPASKGAPAEEVFRYGRATNTLACASCDPTGARPQGVLDTFETSEGQGLLVDRPGIWESQWIAGDIPGWTRSEEGTTLYQSRYLSDGGRLIFDATDGLVPADVNGKNDVYEYETDGEGSCAGAGGCVSLISSGTSSRESAFLDASESANDVFFLTSAPLLSTDHDTNFDVYDARICSAASPCVTPPPSEVKSCAEANECKPPATSASAFVAPATVSPSGVGNLAPPKSVVLPTKAVKLTKAQELAKALKTCRRIKTKKKRVSCERQARKRYAPKKAKRGKKASKAATVRRK
jgi:DNA-binding beta-propeller fold protein YncE